MSPPKISVVLNNYNYAEFLETCVESVLAQTYPNVELVIVDDGSTDTSREILQRYRDRALVIFKPNGGETSGRNEGFRHVSGDIVAFLDADDYWKPNAIEKVVEHWRPTFSKLQFRLKVIDHLGNITGTKMPRCRLDRGRVDTLLLSTGRYITCPTSGNFYARQFLENIFPVPVHEWPQSMDSYGATYAGFDGEIGAIQEPLGYYRVHAHNATRVASQGSGLKLRQVESMIERCTRLRTLIEKIAVERNLKFSPGIVTSHWLYLKLEIARLRLLPDASLTDLFTAGRKMVVSVVTCRDLTLVRRLQLIAWTFASLLLPRGAVGPLLKSGFDLAPSNWLVRVLRRL